MTAAKPLLEAADHFLASIEKPARLLIAISGGSDSTGLLLSLHQSLGRSGLSDISLVAATIDHALRPASAVEAQAVQAFCKQLGIAHIIRRWDGDKPKSGLSMAAREARYRLLCDMADDMTATAIVTGHTLDDQDETISMRSARSDRDDDAGLSGMADAVLIDRRHWVVRPLLQSRRADIRSFLTQQHIGWIDDPSNEDPDYERARTRQKLSAAEGQGRVLSAGGADRRQDLSDAAALLLRDHASGYGATVVKIAPAGPVGDSAVLRHALAHLSAVIGGRRHPPGRDSMDRVLAFVATGLPGRVTAGRVMFDRRRDGLFLLREKRDIPQIELAPDENTVWDGRVQMHNPFDAPVSIAAATSGFLPPEFAGLPSGIAARAAGILPRVEMSRSGQEVTERVSKQPVLGPYDRFLPRFDLRLANQIAALLGRDAYPPPPC